MDDPSPVNVQYKLPCLVILCVTPVTQVGPTTTKNYKAYFTTFRLYYFIKFFGYFLDSSFLKPLKSTGNWKTNFAVVFDR